MCFQSTTEVCLSFPLHRRPDLRLCKHPAKVLEGKAAWLCACSPAREINPMGPGQGMESLASHGQAAQPKAAWLRMCWVSSLPRALSTRDVSRGPAELCSLLDGLTAVYALLKALQGCECCWRSSQRRVWPQDRGEACPAPVCPPSKAYHAFQAWVRSGSHFALVWSAI